MGTKYLQRLCVVTLSLFLLAPVSACTDDVDGRNAVSPSAHKTKAEAYTLTLNGNCHTDRYQVDCGASITYFEEHYLSCMGDDLSFLCNHDGRCTAACSEIDLQCMTQKGWTDSITYANGNLWFTGYHSPTNPTPKPAPTAQTMIMRWEWDTDFSVFSSTFFAWWCSLGTFVTPSEQNKWVAMDHCARWSAYKDQVGSPIGFTTKHIRANFTLDSVRTLMSANPVFQISAQGPDLDYCDTVSGPSTEDLNTNFRIFLGRPGWSDAQFKRVPCSIVYNGKQGCNVICELDPSRLTN